jgi:hypothetical protein
MLGKMAALTSLTRTTFNEHACQRQRRMPINDTASAATTAEQRGRPAPPSDRPSVRTPFRSTVKPIRARGRVAKRVGPQFRTMGEADYKHTKTRGCGTRGTYRRAETMNVTALRLAWNSCSGRVHGAGLIKS